MEGHSQGIASMIRTCSGSVQQRLDSGCQTGACKTPGLKAIQSTRGRPGRLRCSGVVPGFWPCAPSQNAQMIHLHPFPVPRFDLPADDLRLFEILFVVCTRSLYTITAKPSLRFGAICILLMCLCPNRRTIVYAPTAWKGNRSL